MTRAQQLRAEVSEIAHESFDGAMVVKTLGREVEETDRFRAKAHELRDVNIRVGRIRAAFDPTLAACPTSACSSCWRSASRGCSSGATDAGDVVTVAYLLTIVSFPIRSIGWLLGEFPRSVVGFHRTRRGDRGDRCDALRRPTALPASGRAARLEVEGLGYSYDADAPLLDGVTFDVEPGRTVALVGATASGKSTLTSLMTRLVDPDAARSGSTASTCVTSAAASWPTRSRSSARPPSSSTTPSAATSRWAPTSATRRSGRRCAPPRPTASSPRWPTGSTPRSASAARRSRAGSGSGSPSPARSYAGRGC